MAKLVSVQKSIESEEYPGVFFRDVPVSKLREFQNMAKALAPKDLEDASETDDEEVLAQLGKLIGWLFKEVLVADDGSKFEDAVADPSMVGVVMSSRLIREFSTLASGN